MTWMRDPFTGLPTSFKRALHLVGHKVGHLAVDVPANSMKRASMPACLVFQPKGRRDRGDRNARPSPGTRVEGHETKGLGGRGGRSLPTRRCPCGRTSAPSHSPSPILISEGVLQQLDHLGHLLDHRRHTFCFRGACALLSLANGPCGPRRPPAHSRSPNLAEFDSKTRRILWITTQVSLRPTRFSSGEKLQEKTRPNLRPDFASDGRPAHLCSQSAA